MDCHHNARLIPQCPTDDAQSRPLTSTMDALNRKYGMATLFPASMLLARQLPRRG